MLRMNATTVIGTCVVLRNVCETFGEHFWKTVSVLMILILRIKVTIHPVEDKVLVIQL